MFGKIMRTFMDLLTGVLRNSFNWQNLLEQLFQQNVIGEKLQPPGEFTKNKKFIADIWEFPKLFRKYIP